MAGVAQSADLARVHRLNGSFLQRVGQEPPLSGRPITPLDPTGVLDKADDHNALVAGKTCLLFIPNVLPRTLSYLGCGKSVEGCQSLAVAI